jgi:uncharacterized glyoxalase superfamily protein PhnB
MLANRSMPRSTVIPHIPYRDVQRAAQWLSHAFGFTLRIGMGSHRTQLNVGDDGAVVLTQRDSPPSPCHILVRVDDVDSHRDRAKQNGVKTLSEVATYPYGERQYSAEDLAGHRWTFSQSVADVDPKDWGGTAGQL